MSLEGNRYPLLTVAPSSEWDFNDHVATFSIEMSLIHNVIIRGLNSIWINAPLVKKEDEVAFAGYTLAWIELLDHHHHGEETIIFPFFQTKLDMTPNVDQHAAFLDHVNALKDYMQKVFEGKAEYDSDKTRELVHSFGDILVGHLNDEVSSTLNFYYMRKSLSILKIPTITPERLAQFDKKELDSMLASALLVFPCPRFSSLYVSMLLAHADSIKALPLTTTQVMVILHHDLKTYPTWVRFFVLKLPMPFLILIILSAPSTCCNQLGNQEHRVLETSEVCAIFHLDRLDSLL